MMERQYAAAARVREPAAGIETSRGAGGGVRLGRVGSALIQLQRSHGNQYTRRVIELARDGSPGLRLGPADDQYERDADLMAERAVGQAPARRGSASQTQAGEGVTEPGLLRAIQRARGAGQPLPGGIRRPMEQAFGTDLRAVRVHHGTEADQLNQALQARAFTVGTDIFFGRGGYDPGSADGRALIAHELTHVHQQAGPAAGSIQRLVRHSKFKKKTRLTGREGKSAQTFTDIIAGLKTYQHTRDEADLLPIYGTALRWLRSPASANSSRKKYVERLLPDLEKESAGIGDLWRREQAKLKIDTSGLAEEYKLRAKELIDDPDAIRQGAFGVCGMVSILRPTITYDPERFADLAIRALTDPGLDTERWLEIFQKRANPVQKAVGAEFEYLVSQWLVRHGAGTDVEQSVLRRTRGGPVAERKTKPYDQVFEAQVRFSESFGIAGWEDPIGHFATTSGGLNYLLTSVIGAPSSYKIKVQNFWADYQLARERAGDRGQVLASVTDTAFYRQDDPVTTLPLERKSPGAKYIHWVMIEDVHKAGSYFDIRIWTWSRFFDVRVHKNVVGNYFYSFVTASFPQR